MDNYGDKFYSASILSRSIRNNSVSSHDLWEESVILIRADTPEEAMEKATATGRSMGTTYEAIDGSMVTWEFFKVESVFEILDTIGEGAEIFSRFLRNSEVESLLTPFNDSEEL
jgi:hypothetical protein